MAGGNCQQNKKIVTRGGDFFIAILSSLLAGHNNQHRAINQKEGHHWVEKPIAADFIIKPDSTPDQDKV